MNKKVKWLIAAVIAAVVVFVGGPFVYINFIQEDAPPALSFDDVATSASTVAGATTTVAAGSSDTTAAAGSSDATAASSATTAAATGATTTAAASTGSASSDGIEGTWKAASTSIVGYRVKEVLFGQSTEAVGRTSTLTGSLTVSGTTVSAAEFTVDMTTVASDQSRRDSAFKGRIMDVETYPTATFKLTSPIDLGKVPADKEEVASKATGDLTLKGKTNTVTFDLVARRNGANIEVNGTIPITFADYSIDNPSVAGITTEDNGKLEFLLVFSK